MGDASKQLVVLAIAIAAVVWLVHSSSAPPAATGDWKAAMEHLRTDLATVHASAARRIRTGEIQSANDLFAFINEGMKKSRARSFGDVGRAFQKAVGSPWNGSAAAIACDRVNLEIGRSK